MLDKFGKLCRIAQHSTAQHSTAQHSTALTSFFSSSSKTPHKFTNLTGYIIAGINNRHAWEYLTLSVMHGGFLCINFHKEEIFSHGTQAH